jgi:hypothetical protein
MPNADSGSPIEKLLSNFEADPQKQQMRWTQNGAHLLLQARLKVLNDDLRETFCRLVSGNEIGGTSSTKDCINAPAPRLLRSPAYLTTSSQLFTIENSLYATILSSAGCCFVGCNWLGRPQTFCKNTTDVYPVFIDNMALNIFCANKRQLKI